MSVANKPTGKASGRIMKTYGRNYQCVYKGGDK